MSVVVNQIAIPLATATLPALQNKCTLSPARVNYVFWLEYRVLIIFFHGIGIPNHFQTQNLDNHARQKLYARRSCEAPPPKAAEYLQRTLPLLAFLLGVRSTTCTDSTEPVCHFP